MLRAAVFLVLLARACSLSRNERLDVSSSQARRDESAHQMVVEGTSITSMGTAEKMKYSLLPYMSVLETLAIVLTVALQLSPLRSVLEMRKDRDVHRYDGYPYFTVLFGATQWVLYGACSVISTGDKTFYIMVAANAPGFFFGAFYCSVFKRYVPSGDPRGSALNCYLWAFVGVLAIEIVSLVVFGQAAIWWFAIVGAVSSILISCSPFKTLPEVFATCSCGSWPVDLVAVNGLQSTTMLLFGLGAGDPAIWASNGFGTIAATIQLMLVWHFGTGTKDKSLGMSDKIGSPLESKMAEAAEGYGALAK